jgi:hypoxanthine phosphoribosyltransferase
MKLESNIIDHEKFIQLLDFTLSQTKGVYDCVVGLKRGGLVPAVYTSHKFNIPMYVADITAYNSKGDNVTWHEQSIPVLKDCHRILIVDDILDSGATVAECAKQLCVYGIIDVAVLIAKTSSIRDYDTNYINTLAYGVEISDDSPFIYFPWETKPGE